MLSGPEEKKGTDMKRFMIMLLAVAGLLPWSVSAQITSSAVVGTWDMVHDDWPGTLVINPPDQRSCGQSGSCTYCSYVIDGWYTNGSRQTYFVRGTFQGQDKNRRTSERCKASDHRISFTINSQTFEGYIFTWGQRTMAGYTWWQGIPFAWFAEKR